MTDAITSHPLAWPVPVLLGSAPDCHFCQDGKAALERLGREYPLAISEIDLSSPAGQDLAARHGIAFPPGLLLDGTCVGFGRVSERKVRRLLEQRRQRVPLPAGQGG